MTEQEQKAMEILQKVAINGLDTLMEVSEKIQEFRKSHVIAMEPSHELYDIIEQYIINTKPLMIANPDVFKDL